MINLRAIIEKDLQNPELQGNLMKDIEIEGVTLKAFVANSMLEAQFIFGGHDIEAQKVFKIPLYMLEDAELTPPADNDVIRYAGHDYAVTQMPQDLTAPLLSYRAKLI